MRALQRAIGGQEPHRLMKRLGEQQAIPGTWSLMYGCALISTSASTTRIVGVLGALFVLLALPAFILPESLQTLVLATGFGALHVIFGLLIGSSSGARQS